MQCRIDDHAYTIMQAHIFVSFDTYICIQYKQHTGIHQAQYLLAPLDTCTHY
jgi:hypothetical protein